MSTVRFLAVFFTALALVPTGAHLMELPHKIGLADADYLTVQRLYQGWDLAGIVVFAALLSTAALAFVLRRQRNAFVLALIALLCIVGTQVVFWSLTFPVNQQTSNWTALPANWMELRSHWEYSHAASAVLNLVALGATAAAVVVAKPR